MRASTVHLLMSGKWPKFYGQFTACGLNRKYKHRKTKKGDDATWFFDKREYPLRATNIIKWVSCQNCRQTKGGKR